MEIRLRQKGSVAILDLSGSINVDAANFIESVGYCVHQGLIDILCNFEEVENIDYTGLSVIAVAYKEVINNQGRMKFTNVPVHLQGIFNIAGWTGTFEFYASEEVALNSFKEDRVIDQIKQQKLRRRFRRLPVELKIRYRQKCPAGDFFEGELLDISGVGAYIFGENKFSLGEILDLKLRLPGRPQELEILAKVVWLPDKEIQPHHHPGMGIEFYNISNPLQKEILGFIEKNTTLSPTDN